MNPQQRELFRRALLRVLEANPTQWGLGPDAIGHHTVLFGFPSPNTDTIRLELDYLADKGLVASPEKRISPENRTWRITASGRDYIAAHAE